MIQYSFWQRISYRWNWHMSQERLDEIQQLALDQANETIQELTRLNTLETLPSAIDVILQPTDDDDDFI